MCFHQCFCIVTVLGYKHRHCVFKFSTHSLVYRPCTCPLHVSSLLIFGSFLVGVIVDSSTGFARQISWMLPMAASRPVYEISPSFFLSSNSTCFVLFFFNHTFPRLPVWWQVSSCMVAFLHERAPCAVCESLVQCPLQSGYSHPPLSCQDRVFHSQ